MPQEQRDWARQMQVVPGVLLQQVGGAVVEEGVVVEEVGVWVVEDIFWRDWGRLLVMKGE